MLSAPALKSLFTFPGWQIQHIELNKNIADIRLKRDELKRVRCPHCEQVVGENRRIWQEVKDLPLGSVTNVTITYQAVQGRCSTCKHYFTITPDGINRKAKATERLIHYVCRLSRLIPVKKVPLCLPISESTARRWNHKISCRHLPEPKLDKLRVILVDEKSIGNHHQCVTIVINGDNGEVLHIGEGKKKKSLSSFFEMLTDPQIASIQAIGVDRSVEFLSVILEHAPHVAIIFDKFQLIFNFNKIVNDVQWPVGVKPPWKSRISLPPKVATCSDIQIN